MSIASSASNYGSQVAIRTLFRLCRASFIRGYKVINFNIAESKIIGHAESYTDGLSREQVYFSEHR